MQDDQEQNRKCKVEQGALLQPRGAFGAPIAVGAGVY